MLEQEVVLFTTADMDQYLCVFNPQESSWIDIIIPTSQIWKIKLERLDKLLKKWK
jgi:hypothetical protein